MGAPLQAPADVMAHDLEASGDGLLTYDTINKRQWLDLPLTAGAPLAEVMAYMAPHGKLAEFKFATLADVTDLAKSADVGWTGWSLPFSVEPNAPHLVELLGSVIQSPGGVAPVTNIAMGLIATDIASGVPSFDGTNFHVVSMIVDSVSFGPDGPVLSSTAHGGVFASAPLTWPSAPNLGSGGVGPFWLYRALPEPGAGQLLIQACLGISAAGCRRLALARSTIL